jgi:hypothetical protein
LAGPIAGATTQCAADRHELEHAARPDLGAVVLLHGGDDVEPVLDGERDGESRLVVLLLVDLYRDVGRLLDVDDALEGRGRDLGDEGARIDFGVGREPRLEAAHERLGTDGVRLHHEPGRGVDGGAVLDDRRLLRLDRRLRGGRRDGRGRRLGGAARAHAEREQENRSDTEEFEDGGSAHGSRRYHA